MDAPVQASYTPFFLKSLNQFEDHALTEDLTIEVLKWISHPAEIKNCALTCKGWNSVIPDSLHQRFRMRLGDFSFPICTLFKATHWPSRCLSIPQENLHAEGGTLFYIGKGISTFGSYGAHPLGCLQFLKRDLICSYTGDMSNDYIVLGSHQGTYFLQSSSNPDMLIITKDLKSPSEGNKISIKNLVFSGSEEMNGTWCFPLSNEKIVFLSYDCSQDVSDEDLFPPELLVTMSLLDLNLKTTLTKSFLSKEFIEEFIEGSPIQLGDYFILNKSIIDLQNLTMSSHGFEFGGHETAVYGSSLYLTGDITGSDRIAAYFINPEGKLEKEWGSKQLKSYGDEKDIFIHRLQTNDQFIALNCSVANAAMGQPDAFQCIQLLNKKGLLISEVRLPLGESIIMHLVNDILICNMPKENCLNFWHIPTMQLINQFPWNGPQIVDIQSTNEEVVLLTFENEMTKVIPFQMM